MSTLTKLWKKLIPTFVNDFEGFIISVEEVTEECGGNIDRTRIRIGA